MAFSETYTVASRTSGTTFDTDDLYKWVVLNSDGAVVLPTSTGNVLPFGVLYGVTSTTSAGEAVPVAIDGIAKVRLSASTLAAGDFIAASTSGYGVAPSTDSYTAGQIVSGSSGDIRVVSAKLFSGPLSTP